MDESESTSVRPPSSGRPSPTPSWVMLGFLLGALFVWSLPRRPVVPVAPPVVEKKPEPPPSAPAVPRVAAIEAVFEEWGQFAVWENDTTEVALWNPQANAYTDCFEVLRTSDHNYFRSIPRLTRPVLTHGVKENSPLQFTETPARHQEWLDEVHKENFRTFSGAVRDTFNPPHDQAVPNPAPVQPQTGPGDGRQP